MDEAIFKMALGFVTVFHRRRAHALSVVIKWTNILKKFLI